MTKQLRLFDNQHMRNKKDKANEKKSRGIGVYWIFVIWASVFAIVIALYFISQGVATRNAVDPALLIQPSTYYMITIVVSFSSFVMTTFFSFVIFNHNKTMRDISEDNKKRSEQAEARGEEFRKLQFISTNYSVVDFIDNMLLYEEYKQYTVKLRESKDFFCHLYENDIDMNDVVENFDNYNFLTVKIPFKVVEGKGAAGIRISRFKFSKEGKDHRFVPCTKGSNTLILQDDVSNNQILTVNLITKKDSDFYTSTEIVPFRKIKLNLTMYSLLGVAVTGWTELYFTNPQKLEKNGANQYKINSSQFKISGLPVLLNRIDDEI